MKTIFGEQPSLFGGQIVQNFTTAGFDSGQPNRWQNIFQLDLYKRHDCLFKMISFRKLVHNVF